jgi:hypothetical protein
LFLPWNIGWSWSFPLNQSIDWGFTTIPNSMDVPGEVIEVNGGSSKPCLSSLKWSETPWNLWVFPFGLFKCMVYAGDSSWKTSDKVEKSLIYQNCHNWGVQICFVCFNQTKGMIGWGDEHICFAGPQWNYGCYNLIWDYNGSYT